VQRAPGDAAPGHPRIRCGLGHPDALRGGPCVVRRGLLRPAGIGAGHDAAGLGEASGNEWLLHHLSRAANDDFGAPAATKNASSFGNVQV